jgi:hypothetical protein
MSKTRFLDAVIIELLRSRPRTLAELQNLLVSPVDEIYETLQSLELTGDALPQKENDRIVYYLQEMLPYDNNPRRGNDWPPEEGSS